MQQLGVSAAAAPAAPVVPATIVDSTRADARPARG
jgi:hypothetical protein